MHKPCLPLAKAAVMDLQDHGGTIAGEHQFGERKRPGGILRLDAQIDGAHGCPGFSPVLAAGDEDAVGRERFGVPAAEHHGYPGAVGHRANGGVASQLIGRLAVEDDRGEVVPGVFLGLPIPVDGVGRKGVRRDANHQD